MEKHIDVCCSFNLIWFDLSNLDMSESDLVFIKNNYIDTGIINFLCNQLSHMSRFLILFYL